MSTPEKGAPMDPTFREDKTPVVASNRQRDCYALATLRMEVLDLFPETEWEVSEFDGRNVGHAITFTTPEEESLSDLLLLIESDHRVSQVTLPVIGQTRVEFHHSMRTQDSREPFNLAEAWAEMFNGDEDYEDDDAFTFNEDGF